LNDRLADFSDAMDSLEIAFKAVATVTGNDGSPLVETDGVEPSFCSKRRQLLGRIGDELSFWDRTFRRRHGVPAGVSVADEFVGEECDLAELDDANELASELSDDEDGDAAAGLVKVEGGAQ
jgi:hypothetical protein